MKKAYFVLAILLFVVTAAGIYLGYAAQKKSAKVTPQAAVSPAVTTSPHPEVISAQPLKARDIPQVAREFQFEATVPLSWRAEAVPEIEAINIYDSSTTGATNLDKSQIFIRFFKANDFLTLSTVTIHGQKDTTVNGRPAVVYEIEKKASVANFPNQPSWRNERHVVTDIRVTDDNPSVFYVIAKRPDLADEHYESFLNNFKAVSPVASPNQAATSFVEPVAQFKQRITKKPFGIFITKENSPVQREKFTGYHTGVDVEYSDTADDVPVLAIADGEVTASRTASGYGGVLAIRHTANDAPRLVIYGHLDPKNLPSIGKKVNKGEKIGILGEGGTSETDGERKHLHFAVLTNNSLDLRGYVQSKSELDGWLDPSTLFK